MESGNNLNECLEMLLDVPENASSRLTFIDAESAYLRRDTEQTLRAGVSTKDLFNLISRATQLDQKLNSWSVSVPNEWEFVPAVHFEIPKSVPTKDFMYGTRVDVYPDLFVAGIWNSYRATRIKVLLIICDCINALPHPPTGLLEVCPSSTSLHDSTFISFSSPLRAPSGIQRKSSTATCSS